METKYQIYQHKETKEIHIAFNRFMLRENLRYLQDRPYSDSYIENNYNLIGVFQPFTLNIIWFDLTLSRLLSEATKITLEAYRDVFREMLKPSK